VGGGVVYRRLSEDLPSQREIGLEHWIGSQLIREPPGTSGLKEGAAVADGE
jgi:hypothetical protein